jgi:hypothetical protein
MSKLVPVALAAALLAACGSSNSSTTQSPAPVSGTIGGRAFTPVEIEAIELVSSTACGIPLNPLDPTTLTSMGVRALEVKMTSYAGACTDLETTACRVHGGTQSVTLLVTRLNTVPPYTAPSTLAGDYTVYPSITTFIPEQQNGLPTGVAHVAFAAAAAPDPTCSGTTATPHPATGSLHIAQDGTTVTGTVSLDFDDGSKVSGSFSAARCGGTPGGVCDLVTSLAAVQQLCVPGGGCL